MYALLYFRGAGIAQSVQRQATGWMAERVGVRVPVGQNYSHQYVAQTDSGVHSTSNPIGTASYPIGTAGEAAGA
jgi:hypothetical protein